MSLQAEQAVVRRSDVLCRASEEAAKDPARVQRELLAAILARNSATLFGRDHGFASIRGSAEYASRVPQRSFEELGPYMRRVLRGEPHVLTAAEVVRFNVTSGTTAAPKYLPVTARGRLEAAKMSCQWMGRVSRAHPGLLSRSIGFVCGAAREGVTDSGVPFGSASGMLYEGVPRVLRSAFALPFELSAIGDYTLRYRTMARFALGSDLSLLVSPNPLTLLRLADIGLSEPEALVRGIHNGVLGWDWRSGATGGDVALLAAIERGLRPDRPRAQAVARVFHDEDELRPAACWPNLALIGCWLGGSVGAHSEKLDAYYGAGVAKRDIGYLASEGSMSIPVADGAAAGVFNVMRTAS
jgi:hypothetical protein